MHHPRTTTKHHLFIEIKAQVHPQALKLKDKEISVLTEGV